MGIFDRRTDTRAVNSAVLKGATYTTGADAYATAQGGNTYNQNFSSFNNQKQQLQAYTEWTYAAVHTIAEHASTIDFRLFENRTKMKNVALGQKLFSNPRQIGELMKTMVTDMDVVNGKMVVRKGVPALRELQANPLLDLLNEPNQYMTKNEFFELAFMHLELTGDCFWAIFRDKKTKKPLELWPLFPNMVQVVPDKDQFILGYVYTVNGVQIPFGPRDIIHCQVGNPLDFRRGFSTVMALATTIDTEAHAADYNRKFFYNNAAPDGVLTVEGEMEEKTWKRLKTEWNDTYGGSYNAHRVAILSGGMKFQSVQPSQRDMEFLKGREYNRDQILALFGVPPGLVGLDKSLSRANIESMDYAFMKRIRSKMQRMVNRLTMDLASQFDEKYLVSFTDPVPQDKQFLLDETDSALGGVAYRTINEERAKRGLPPVVGGDEVYIPSMLTPIGLPEKTPDEEETAATIQENPEDPNLDEDDEASSGNSESEEDNTDSSNGGSDTGPSTGGSGGGDASSNAGSGSSSGSTSSDATSDSGGQASFSNAHQKGGLALVGNYNASNDRELVHAPSSNGLIVDTLSETPLDKSQINATARIIWAQLQKIAKSQGVSGLPDIGIRHVEDEHDMSKNSPMEKPENVELPSFPPAIPEAEVMSEKPDDKDDDDTDHKPTGSGDNKPSELEDTPPFTWTDSMLKFLQVRERQAAVFELQFLRGAREVFLAQKAEVLFNIHNRFRPEKSLTKKAAKKKLDNLFDRNKNKAAWLLLLLPTYSTMGNAVGVKAIAMLDDMLASNNLEPPRPIPDYESGTTAAKDYYSERANTISTGIDDETEKQLRASLMEGTSNNEGLGDLADRVESVYGAAASYRAQRIGASESFSIFNFASMDAWGQLGVVQKYVWVVDGHPCPICSSVAGEVSDGQGNFSISGPEAHVNCRCSTAPYQVNTLGGLLATFALPAFLTIAHGSDSSSTDNGE